MCTNKGWKQGNAPNYVWKVKAGISQSCANKMRQTVREQVIKTFKGRRNKEITRVDLDKIKT